MFNYFSEKDRLKRKYLKALDRVEREMDTYDCGLSLARYITPRIDTLVRELEAVEDEVRAAMKADGFVPIAPASEEHRP